MVQPESVKKVIRRISQHCTDFKQSVHIDDKKLRNKLVEYRGGKPYMSFLVSYIREHDGLLIYQIHTITDTGIVYVGDPKNKILVTRYPLTLPERFKFYGITDPQLLKQGQINLRVQSNLFLGRPIDYYKEVKDPFEDIKGLNDEDVEQKAYVVYEDRMNDGKRSKLAYLHDPFQTEELAIAALKDRVGSYAKNEDPKFTVRDNKDGTYYVESVDNTFKSTFHIKHTGYFYGMMRGVDTGDTDLPEGNAGNLKKGVTVAFKTPLTTHNVQQFDNGAQADTYKRDLAKKLAQILGTDAVKTMPDGSIVINTRSSVTIK